MLDAIYTHHTSRGRPHRLGQLGQLRGAPCSRPTRPRTTASCSSWPWPGMSFYAASGDDGSSDCHRSLGFDGLQVDDPAVQPYATGVGGTQPDASPAYSETVWGGHGTSRRRRGRRRLALVHRAALAEGHGRDPHRPVEQDQVRRQDALVPRGARRRVRRRSDHRVRHQLQRTTAAGTSSAARRRRRRSWPPSRPTRTGSASQNGGGADGLRESVPVPRVQGRPGDVPRRHGRQQQHPRRIDVPRRRRLRPGQRPRLGQRATRWRPTSPTTPARRSRCTAPRSPPARA